MPVSNIMYIFIIKINVPLFIYGNAQIETIQYFYKILRV